MIYGLFVSLFAIDAYLVHKDLEKLSFNMTSSVLVFVTVIKIIMLRTEIDDVEIVVDNLKNHLYLNSVGISTEDKEILNKKSKDILLITKLFYLILFVIYPLRLVADRALETRAYIVPIPFKEQFSDYYELLYGIQIFSVLHFLITVIAHDMFIYGIIIRFIGHYEILQKNILKIKNMYPRKNFEKYVPGYSDTDDQKHDIRDILLGKAKNSETIRKILNEYGYDKLSMVNWRENKQEREEKVFKLLSGCIFHHQVLLRQIKSFCKVYSKPLVIQAMGAVLLIGIVALYSLFISTQITLLLAQQVLYVLTTMLNILYLCSFGTDITNKSREAGFALYDTPWYEMNVKNQKTIFFILKNMEKPPELKGGGLVVINQKTYLKFLQMSYNMVAVLKNAY